MLEVARLGFKRHILSTPFQNLIPARLQNSYLNKVKMSHGEGGGQKSAKKSVTYYLNGP